jgi:NADPH-dependent curcumin reductase CurA
VLKRRPIGLVDADCFEVVERPVPALEAGQALAEVHYLGIDPTIRGWIDERGNYMAPVAIGDPVRANGVGVIVETTNPDEYPLGAAFMALMNWQEYRVLVPNENPVVTRLPEGMDLIGPLNVGGHIGVTALIGVTEVAHPAAGETFVVSAAASGVGSVAGQIAKLLGAEVIGIAGSEEKCAWVVDELGFDACINYKTEDVRARLKELCPKGVDVFFDNVGGELLDTVLTRIARKGRVVLCGDISTYNLDVAPPPLRNHRYLMGRGASMAGFNTLDYWERYFDAAAQLSAWVAEGKIKHREHILEGIEECGPGLVRLFNGDHLGKLVVQVRR